MIKLSRFQRKFSINIHEGHYYNIITKGRVFLGKSSIRDIDTLFFGKFFTFDSILGVQYVCDNNGYIGKELRYDILGYDIKGFTKEGIHKNKTRYNDDGYDILGYDIKGFTKGGIHKNKTRYNDDGYDILGYDIKGFTKEGIHKNKTRYNDDGYDILGYDKIGYNKDGYNVEGYNKEGHNQKGQNAQGFDVNGYNNESFFTKLRKLLIGLNFVSADKFLLDYNIHYISQDQYLLDKKFIIESLLKNHEFLEADKLFQQQGIQCLTYTEYVSIKKEYIKDFFHDSEGKILNDEKYCILADMSKYTLIKARAGTGKTTLLSYKIKLLVDSYNIKPDEILAFAFNKKAAAELKNRTQRLGVKDFCSSMTFHSFAGRILSKTIHENYELLFDNNESMKDQDKTLSQFVQEIFDEINWEEHKEELYKFYRKEVDELDSLHSSMNKEEVYAKVRNNESSNVTLDGRRVKSKAEKRIADFLFEYGIGYRYEYPATQKLEKDNMGIRRQLKPDFTLIKFNIDSNEDDDIVRQWDTIIEFRGRPGEANYKKNMEWKISKYKQLRKNLVEFSIYDIAYHDLINRRNLFEQKIKEKLEGIGIVCNKLPFETLFDKCKVKFINNLTKKVISFISKAKQNRLYPDDIFQKRNNNKHHFNEKQNIFYNFAVEIYKRYQEKLKKTGSKDFNDILFECSNILMDLGNNNDDVQFKIGTDNKNYDHFQFIKNLRYVLVDEYQDFSLLFYCLLNSIKKINPHISVINVGDDWQLINTFAGSKITYIKEYEKYFVGGKKFTLLETNRCPRKIVDLSNKFMQGYGEGAKSKLENIAGIIHGYTKSDECSYDKWIDDIETGKKRNVYYVNTQDQARFFGKHYKNFEKLEIMLEKEGQQIKSEVIIVPKENQQYAQIIKTLYQICINEKIYTSSFDTQKEHLEKNKIINVMILDRSNTLFFDVDHWDTRKDDFTIDDIQEHLVYLLYNDVISCLHIENVNTIKIVKDNISKLISAKSIHQSKGGEAEIVIILGIGEEGNYPMLHSDNELNAIFDETIQDALDEERRLFYVAITRAKNKLYYISEKEIPKGKDHDTFLVDSWGL